MGVLGIVLLTFAKDHSHSVIPSIYQQLIGIILGCLAGLTYTSYTWVARRLIENGVDSKSAVSGLFGGGALLLLPSLWFTGTHLFSSPTNTIVSLYLAVIPMFLAYLLFGFGLQFIAVSQATIITLIEPVVATVLAVLIIGERFKLFGWLGIALVSLCLLMQAIEPAKFNEYEA